MHSRQHYSPGWASSFKSYLHPSLFRAITVQFLDTHFAASSYSDAFCSMSCLVVLPSVRFSLYEFPQQEDFTRLESQFNAQPPNWRTSVPLIVWPLPFNLSAKGDLTSSYATGGIALRVIAVLKLRYHNKVEAPAGENPCIKYQ